MTYKQTFFTLVILFVAFAINAEVSVGQSTSAKSRKSAQTTRKHAKDSKAETADSSTAAPVMWKPVNIKGRDLFYGPGGRSMQPDLSSITFIERERHGANIKYRIKDGAGNEWIAKLGHEDRPETAAVRLLYGLGYETEINYLVPTLTIPGKGTFHNVRLEARPANIKRLEIWKWHDNPFIGSNEFQGLKMMMVFMTNWDLDDRQNKVFRFKDDPSNQMHYMISDLGATFGKMGNNNLPIFYRLGRKTNDPQAWSKTHFVKGVKNGRVIFAFKGKHRDLMNNITVEQARWLVDLLRQIDDSQFRDAYRAANFSPPEIDLLLSTSKRKIAELGSAVEDSKLGRK